MPKYMIKQAAETKARALALIAAGELDAVMAIYNTARSRRLETETREYWLMNRLIETFIYDEMSARELMIEELD